MTKVSNHDIANIIDDFLVGKASKDKTAQVIAAYLMSERRTKDLDSIMRKVLELRSSKGVYEAELVSAHELDDRIKKQLSDIVRQNYSNAKKVIMNEMIVPALIGGLTFTASDISLDLSIHDRLRSLPQLLNNAT